MSLHSEVLAMAEAYERQAAKITRRQRTWWERTRRALAQEWDGGTLERDREWYAVVARKLRAIADGRDWRDES